MSVKPVRIAVDIMGGDHGPGVLLEGAMAAALSPEHEVILVGRRDEIESRLKRMGGAVSRARFVHADQVVDMTLKPKEALRMGDSSIAVCAELVRAGEADALVTMGNTGACMAVTMLKWRKLPGISRPALAQVIPIPNHHVLLLDVGANVDCRPQHLVDFAWMGSIYAAELFDRPRPRIGVLSVGEEEIKGNDLSVATLAELRRTSLNVVGNAEGRDLFSGRFDVVVCDGFVGNVVLKFGEGLVKMILDHMKGEISKSIVSSLAAMAIKPHFVNFKRQIGPDEFGGAPLLGVNGACIIGHGSSGPRAMQSAILTAAKLVRRRINEKIVEAVASASGHSVGAA
jgi:glycerol-3-phosphate acyltransferase PlsX